MLTKTPTPWRDFPLLYRRGENIWGWVTSSKAHSYCWNVGFKMLVCDSFLVPFLCHQAIVTSYKSFSKCLLMLPFVVPPTILYTFQKPTSDMIFQNKSQHLLLLPEILSDSHLHPEWNARMLKRLTSVVLRKQTFSASPESSKLLENWVQRSHLKS